MTCVCVCSDKLLMHETNYSERELSEEIIEIPISINIVIMY